ncbi:ABC transporter permease [Mycoplasmopsis citelli]|uniref:ABC transporter permease n=1 Tax=Mycoplasmopsis citelli TaxID=171281 RepID=UPI0021148DD4|nr:ABC transporter permease [Mycoplasmopsis citelli]UUD36505.1 ABC transporter permease [Mycoplasmopsis citelli]
MSEQKNLKKTHKYNNIVYHESSNKVYFTNKRVSESSFKDIFSFVEHPVVQTVWRILKIIIEFFIIGFIVITIAFFLVNAVPGSNTLTAGLQEAQRIALEQKYGLNLPIFIRYLNYLNGLAHLDFGISLSLFPAQPISDWIGQRFLKSFYIGIFSVFLTVAIGIPLGIWVGKNPGKFIDNFSTVIVSIFSSVPSIVFALVLVFLGRSIGIPYVFNEKDFITYILPGLALSLTSIIVYIKYIRTELNRELNSVHAKFAYLKGVSKNRFVWKHALKPSLFPIATFFPAVIFSSFLGSIFIEQIFLISGSGATLLQAIQTKDYNVILFLMVIFSILTILSYASRDLLYEAIDPRVRRRGK